MSAALQTKRTEHSPSQAAARSLASAPDRPPAVTKLSASEPCFGLAFLLYPGTPLPDLSAIRDEIASIREGALGEEDNARRLLLVLFRTGNRKAAPLFPTALPLALSRPGVLASYLSEKLSDRSLSVGATSHAAPPTIRAVELWWNGRAHNLSLHRLTEIERSWLWEMPQFTVHEAHSPTKETSSDPMGSSALGKEPPRIRKAAKPFGTAIEQGAASRLFPTDESSSEDPFREMREAFDQPSPMSEQLRALGWQLARTWPAVWNLIRAFAWIVGILLGLVFLVAILASGGGLLIPFAIGFFAVMFFRSLFGGGGGGQGQAGGYAVPPPSSGYKGPGLFENFRGWLAWKNPFSRVHQQLNQRVRQVRGMIERGQVDEALKMALRLGGNSAGKRKQKNLYPRELPSARAKLDFELGDSPFTSPILDDAYDWQLRQSYVELAQRLKEEGDYRRAAFIYSQLLGEHQEAVMLLEKAGLPDEALRLALGSRIDPTITVRLLYDAGRKEDALALAVRANCFDQLALQSHGEDAVFHVDVIKAWTDALIDSGQILRAVQVTDALANEVNANPVLLDLRRSWLTAVILGEQSNGQFPAEAIVRAILASSLKDGGLFAGYPARLPATGDELLDLALGELREAMLDPEQSEALLSVIAVLRRLGSRRSTEQEAFWAGPASALLEQVAQCMIRQCSDRLEGADLDALSDFLKMAGHRVLSRDIRKLDKLVKSEVKPSREWSLPPVEAEQAAVVHGCVLSTGAILVWRENELLELLNSKGAVLWRKRVERVIGLVAAGQGRKALVVRESLVGLSQVSCFDTVSFSLVEVGDIALKAFHDVTSDLSWLVQVGGQIGALRLACLTAARPSFEFLWSCSLTERLQVTGFNQNKDSASWATVDVSRDRFGVTEVWRYRNNGELLTYLLRPGEDPRSGEPNYPMQWAWIESGAPSLAPLTQDNTWLSAILWNEGTERQIRGLMAKRGMEQGIDQLIACDFGRSAVVSKLIEQESGASIQTTVRAHQTSEPVMRLIHERGTELKTLARVPLGSPDRLLGRKKRSVSGSGRVLLADNHGRLFLVDPVTARVVSL